MSVQLNVPLELIRADAAVAEAVSNLLLALRSDGRRGRRPTVARVAQAVPRAPRPARAKKASRPRPKSTEAARRFVEILRERGKVTTAEAQKALRLPDPRAIGGIVGSLNRWSGKKPGTPRIEMTDGENGEKTYSLAKA